MAEHTMTEGDQNSGARKRKAVAQRREESPRTKAKRAATSARDQALRKLKQQCDQANTAQRDCDRKAKELVEVKGYPKSFEEFWQTKIEEYRAKVQVEHAYYAGHMTTIPCSPWNAEHLQKGANEIMEHVGNLERMNKSFKDSVVTELKNLVNGKGST